MSQESLLEGFAQDTLGRPDFTDTALRLVKACRGDNPTLPDFLEWLAARLVQRYGEDPNVDFVQALRRRAGMIREALSPFQAQQRYTYRDAQGAAGEAGELWFTRGYSEGFDSAMRMRSKRT